MSTFDYSQCPLPTASSHIRLITVFPPRPASPLCCDISLAPIDSPPPYAALSYTWGRKDRSSSIRIASHECRVTPSLESALLHLRHPTEPVTLWIDQICIDQDNVPEKNEQVPLMSRIYRNAEQVLIWLGPPAHGSDALMDFWATVGGEAREWGMEQYYTKEKYPELMGMLAENNPTDEKTIQFHNICGKAALHVDHPQLKAWNERPWFTRVWVIQEYSLGSRAFFVCGHKRVSVELVMLARQAVDFGVQIIGSIASTNVGQWQGRTVDEWAKAFQSWWEVGNPLEILVPARRRRQAFDKGSGKGDSLFMLLKKFYTGRLTQSEDERDRVYGFLALAVDADKLDIKPDYAKEYTLVFGETARAIIKNGDCDILGLVQYPKIANYLPSWAPDWCSILRPSFCARAGAEDPPLFKASGSSTPVLMPTNDEKVLAVEGLLVDEIEDVGSPWVENEDKVERRHVAYLSYLSQIRIMCSLSAIKGSNIYETAERRQEGIWRIPIGDIEETVDQDVCRATSSFAEGYQLNLAAFERQEQWKTLSQAEFAQLTFEYPDIAVRYRSRMHEMRSKRPFISKLGFVGMGPLPTKSGDMVVVLLGANVPYILRPLGNETFSLVGEAYCDGIMDGKMMPDGKTETFSLV